MYKIPTIFDRDAAFKVFDQPKSGCEWVFAGEGKATEKLDGTNIRLTIRSAIVVRVEKRRNPNKHQKKLGIVDGWYMDADPNHPADRWLFEAVSGTDTSGLPDGEHSAEALGPKIQGNPLGLEEHRCVFFDLEVPVYEDVPRSFDALKVWLAERESRFSAGHLIEGLVFHHEDGRRAKIKRKDFPE